MSGTRALGGDCDSDGESCGGESKAGLEADSLRGSSFLMATLREMATGARRVEEVVEMEEREEVVARS